MFNSNSTPFTMPVQPANNSGFGFGGNGFDSIIALAILAMIFGWGNGGWGGYGFGGGQSTSVYEGYVLNNDFSQISKQISDTYNMTDRKFEGLANGMCSMGYETQGLINGVNTNIMQGTNAIQSQLADCCCKTQTAIGDVKYAIGSTGAEISRGVERGFADTNYNLATQANMLDRGVSEGFCQTNFNAERNTRSIVDSQNAGTQAILAKLNDMETSRLREKLEAERDAKYALQGQLDRAQLRTDIVNDVRPCPKPAYITCNPFGCNCQQNVYGTTIA